MHIPKRLKEGDTIGLVAPSVSASLIRKEVWEFGMRRLATKGFHIKPGRHIFGR